MEYLSDIAMRIVLRMDELEGASTVEKAEAICDLFEASRHQEPVNESGETVGDRFLTFDLCRSFDPPGGSHPKANRDLYNVIDWTGQHRGQIALTREDAEDISPIRPLRAASIPKVEPGVKVKTLEWTACAPIGGASFDIAARHRLGVAFAETPLGTYVIARGPANRYEAWLRSGQVTGSYGTKDEAKAAAQADYEQRILSSLQKQESGEAFECPINQPGCTKNCGSYGCGN